MSGASRHKACNHCREKKIRCDGHQPCQRCRGSGDDCSYTTKSKASKLEFAQALETFNERLLQAENALAVQQNAPAHPPPILPSDAFEPESLASWSHSLGNFHSLGEENLALASNDSHAAGLPTAGLDFNDPAAYTLPLVPPFQRSGEPLPPTDASFSTSSTAAIAPFGINTSNGGWSDQLGVASQSSSSLSSGGMNKDWSSSGISSRITTPGTSIAQTDALERLPYNVGNDLFQTYSQTVHHYFPMIDGQRFQSRMGETPAGSELVALRFAIWAHAAVFIPQYSYLSDKFYLQARMQIEITETEDPRRFFTIPALQTLILTALYEIKQTCFTRSWVSVSRATWLAHSLGLHKMDTSGSNPANSPPLHLLPCTDDPMILEERRRTFWVMLQINCFSTVGICWNLGLGFDHAEISTFLPVDDLDEQNLGRSVTLGHALKSSVPGLLCPLQGAALVASLCIRCITHVTQVNKEYSFESPTYDFWTHHHHLNELINHASNTVLVHLKPNQFLTDPNVLSLNMILQATTICLHQAVISRVSKVEKHKAHGSIVPESEQRCTEAVMDFVSTVRYMNQINTAKINPFIPWTFYVALQYLVRKSQADASLKPSSAHPSSIVPYPSPMISPRGPGTSYHQRTPSMNTSDRFGTFQSTTNNNMNNLSEASYATTTTTTTNNGISTSTTPIGSKRTINGLTMTTILDNAQILDSTYFLRSRLSALKATIPLAKVFEAQIEEEIEGGREGTEERIVGLARFLPGGAAAAAAEEGSRGKEG